MATSMVGNVQGLSHSLKESSHFQFVDEGVAFDMLTMDLKSGGHFDHLEAMNGFVLDTNGTHDHQAVGIQSVANFGQAVFPFEPGFGKALLEQSRFDVFPVHYLPALSLRGAQC